MLWLEVVGDTNDADYVTRREKIESQQIERFKPLIAAIKAKGGHNWCTSEYSHDQVPEEMYAEFDPELLEAFNEYVPHGEYGIHTIDKISIVRGSEEVLLGR